MKILSLTIMLVALSACTPNTGSTPYASGAAYTQVERLGRPAINEGLIVSNANLNLWNSVPPSADLTPGGSAIVTEAGSTLTAIHSYGVAQGLAPVAVSAVVSGFLPDVMRIDTTKTLSGASATLTTITTGGMAYVGCVSATKSVLCGGRKLRDNVIQITVNYLANSGGGNFAAVSYDPMGAGPAALLGAFPYEAAPN